MITSREDIKPSEDLQVLMAGQKLQELLAESEEDVAKERIASMQSTVDDLHGLLKEPGAK